jgi:serine/threonine protein kinase
MPPLPRMLQYGVREDNQMCSTFYKHFMAFEYYPKNMEQEIEDKNGNKQHEFYSKYYSEPEVWYIIDALVSLLMSFKERGYHHGDIQPKNIFIDPHGFIKMSDNSLINYGRTGYLKMIFEPGYKAALSPQLLLAYRSKELHPNHDPIKSDIFSIGITCLCAALNTNIGHYYNFTTHTLNSDNIKRSYDEMSRLGFSHQLISTIQGFLDENEDRRTSIEEIYSFLSKYQEAIKKGTMTFVGANAPIGVAGFPAQSGIINNSSIGVPPNRFPTPAGPAGVPAVNRFPSQPATAGYAPIGQRQMVESRYVS